MSNIHDLGSRIQKMDLYEAIFCRKSVRNYRKSPVSQETQDEILHYFYEIPEVFGEINTAAAVCDNADGSVRMHLPGEVNAPYYLVFYSEKCVNDLMNIGYLIQQMSLFLCTRGFGACNVTNLQLRKDLQKKGTLQAMGMLAFGVPAGPLTHKENEFNRLPLEKLCSYQEKRKSGPSRFSARRDWHRPQEARSRGVSSLQGSRFTYTRKSISLTAWGVTDRRALISAAFLPTLPLRRRRSGSMWI